MGKPMPGTAEAIRLHCSCPVLDNCHGAGARILPGGRVIFWFNGDCPLHGLEAQQCKDAEAEENEGATVD